MNDARNVWSRTLALLVLVGTMLVLATTAVTACPGPYCSTGHPAEVELYAAVEIPIVVTRAEVLPYAWDLSVTAKLGAGPFAGAVLRAVLAGTSGHALADTARVTAVADAATGEVRLDATVANGSGDTARFAGRADLHAMDRDLVRSLWPELAAALWPTAGAER